jgi:TonB-linked SusC/RagA family outer membrane protein
MKKTSTERISKLSLTLAACCITLAGNAAPLPGLVAAGNSKVYHSAFDTFYEVSTAISRSAGFVVVAQEVRGKITDQNGLGLPGVSVSLKGTTTGITTDINGNFSLRIPEGTQDPVLVFSFVGYITKEIAVGNQSVINVTLEEDLKQLEEIVVVGYGTQKKADVTGATSTVDAKEFNSGVINNPLQAVQGKVAGLVIQSPGSDPTNTRPTIRLRGTSSLSANSEPLIVVDGVAGASLNSIAPEDIERVDVLKDASASAIYGSRGANGVIVITTKRGKSGQTQIEYNGYVGMERVAARPDVLSADEFRQRLKEVNSPENDFGASTDWFKEMEQPGISQNHSLGISGGTDNFNYRGSLVYLDQGGAVKNSGYDRLNARINLTQRAFNNRLEVQVLASQQVANKNYIDYGAYRSAIKINPTYPVYNEDGTFFQPQGIFELENPVARLMQITNEAREKTTLLNGKIFFEVIKGLKVGVNASVNNFNSLAGYFMPSTFSGFGNKLSDARRTQNESVDKLVETTISYGTSFGKSNLNIVAGHTYQQVINEGFWASNRDFPDIFGYNNLGAGNAAADGSTNRNMASWKNEALLVGVLARVNYTYNDRYLLTANIRRDGSSRFGVNNRYGVFPSASVGWRISEENFMKGNSIINDLKIRLGYGITGNQDGIGNYASRLMYAPSGNYFTNGAFKKAYSFTQNANPDLKWETSAMSNLGLDFSFLNSRVSGSLELYNKDTRDLLYNYPIAIGQKYGPANLTAVTGSILANVGHVNNRGIELSLNYFVIDKEKFNWETTLNLAHNQNKIVSLSNDFYKYNTDNPVMYGSFGSGQGGIAQPSVLQEGYPIGQFFGPKFKGFDDAGNYIYEDHGGGGKDPYGKDRTYLGSPQPKLTFGWNNSFTYGNFDLNFFFRGSLGQKAANGPYIYFAHPDRFPGGNVLRDAFETGIGTGVAPQWSSLWLEDASFIRLDNFRFGYRLPAITPHLKNAQVYISGQNLFVLTKYRGVDPEVRTDGFSPGVDPVTFYPRTRSFVTGISVSF